MPLFRCTEFVQNSNRIPIDKERLEILDWYHLKENLYKIGGSIKRLKKAETLQCLGNVEATKTILVNLRGKQVKNFCAYLDLHRHRIVNYEYYQAEQLCSIGSGAVESAIKVLGKRIKISGAQMSIRFCLYVALI